MNQPDQPPSMQHAPRPGPPPWQGQMPAAGPPPTAQQQVPPPPWQQRAPYPPAAPVRPKRPLRRGHGWWTAAGVFAFICMATSGAILGLLVMLFGVVTFFAGAEGGDDGLRQAVSSMAGDGSIVTLAVFVTAVTAGALLAGICCLRRTPLGPSAGVLTGLVQLVTPLIISAGPLQTQVWGSIEAVGLIVCASVAFFFPQGAERHSL